jgi:predicted phage terminase large subunit-like protein
MAAAGADRFLLDQRRERMDMPCTVEAIRAVLETWPQAGVKFVEDRANGPAVIASLRHAISGLITVNPEGGKTARAAAVSPQIESGNVYTALSRDRSVDRRTGGGVHEFSERSPR